MSVCYLHAVKALPCDDFPERQLLQVANLSYSSFLTLTFAEIFFRAGHPKKFGRPYNVNMYWRELLIKEERAAQEDDVGMGEESEKETTSLLVSCLLQRNISREFSSARRWYVSFIRVIEKGIKLRYFLFITSTTLPASFFRIPS